MKIGELQIRLRKNKIKSNFVGKCMWTYISQTDYVWLIIRILNIKKLFVLNVHTCLELNSNINSEFIVFNISNETLDYKNITYIWKNKHFTELKIILTAETVNRKAKKDSSCHFEYTFTYLILTLFVEDYWRKHGNTNRVYEIKKLQSPSISTRELGISEIGSQTCNGVKFTSIKSNMFPRLHFLTL